MKKLAPILAGTIASLCLAVCLTGCDKFGIPEDSFTINAIAMTDVVNSDSARWLAMQEVVAHYCEDSISSVNDPDFSTKHMWDLSDSEITALGGNKYRIDAILKDSDVEYVAGSGASTESVTDYERDVTVEVLANPGEAIFYNFKVLDDRVKEYDRPVNLSSNEEEPDHDTNNPAQTGALAEAQRRRAQGNQS